MSVPGYYNQTYNLLKKRNTMNKIKALCCVLIASVALAACGKKIEIPPAHVGKVLTKDGFREDILAPSKSRLEPCFFYCDSLVLVEASDYAVEESLVVFMPKDELNMTVDVRGVYQINNSDTKVINGIFNRITAEPTNETNVSIITANKIYNTYVVQVIRENVRSFLTQYTINDIQENRESINALLIEHIREKTKHLPIQPTQFGMADVQLPKVILEAKEAAKQREIAIQQEEANKLVALTKASAELEIAEKDRAVRLLRARTTKEENQIMAAAVTPTFLQYRYLEVLQDMANNPNTVFLPYDALQTPGASIKMFNNLEK